jgi:hypothetical protein
VITVQSPSQNGDSAFENQKESCLIAVYCDKDYDKRNSRNSHQTKCPLKPVENNTTENIFSNHLITDQESNDQAIEQDLETNANEDVDLIEDEVDKEDNESVKSVQIVKAPSRTKTLPVRRKIVSAKQSTEKRRLMGSIKVLCSGFVKLSNSLKSSIKKKAILKKVLYTVLKDKCADHRLNKLTVEKMIELLKSDQDTQEIHFKLDKNDLFKEYLNFSFTLNQMKVIDDLSNIEVTEENINQQLVFATYYAKLCKLMLRYNLASTDRSKESSQRCCGCSL